MTHDDRESTQPDILGHEWPGDLDKDALCLRCGTSYFVADTTTPCGGDDDE